MEQRLRDSLVARGFTVGPAETELGTTGLLQGSIQSTAPATEEGLKTGAVELIAWQGSEVDPPDAKQGPPGHPPDQV